MLKIFNQRLICPEIGCEVSTGSSPILYPNGCSPFDPGWPDCLEEFCTEDDPGGTPEPANACGCPLPANRRQPAGCIQVDDTQFAPHVPVQNVKVTILNGWFSWKRDWTDQNGCWSTSNTIGKNNKLRMWVTFKNNRLKVHELSVRRLQNLWFALTDNRGKKSDPPFNNINTLYINSADLGSKTKANWVAAHTVNSMEEFHAYAGADGINTPPSKTRVTISNASNRASAPMFRQLSRTLQGQWVNFLNLPATLLVFVPGARPDVFLGIDGRASDFVKSTMYHEFAHTSHYTLVGAGYWNRVILHTVLHSGRGTPPFNGTFDNITNVEATGIAESWADHIQRDYADRTYGTNVSIINVLGGSGLNPYIALNERVVLDNGWVPSGLWNDLIDVSPGGSDPGTPPTTTAGVEFPSGFTNGTLFPALSNTRFMPLRTTLGTIGAGNTSASINALMMTGYGMP